MNVFGYIRFSYMGRSDVRLAQLGEGSGSAYFDQLFASQRMETRFHYFEKLCLPSLVAQTDQDFSIVVLASEDMPQPFRARLEQAVANIPQITVYYRDSPQLGDALNPIIADLMANETRNSVHFRLDDDDALAATAVANLRRFARHLYAGNVISMSRGFHLFTHDGKPYLTPKIEPYIAIGWARIHKPGDFRNPFTFSHRQIASRVPSFLNPRPISYIHTLHPHSDSNHHHGTTLPRLVRENPEFDDAEGLAERDGQITEAFPGFSVEALLEISKSAPENKG